MKNKKIIFGILAIILLISIFFVLKNKTNQDKINPKYWVVDLEKINELKYHIEIDCSWVKESLNVPTVWFPNQTIELCKYVYPDLWEGAE